MVSKRLVRLEIAIRQNKSMLTLILFWFALNLWVLLFTTGDPLYSLAVLVYISDLDTPYGHFYATYSEFVVFGLLVGLVTVDLFRNYDPKLTSETLATRLRNHAIIVGYNHLGVRLARYLEKVRVPYVVVSKNKDVLSELYEEEKPAIYYDPMDDEFPKKIRMKRAKYMFLLENELVFNLKLVIMAREMGSEAGIVVRCFEDEMAKVFRDYNCKTISTSATTAGQVFENYLRTGIKTLHLIGFNHFSERVAVLASKKTIKTTIIAQEEAETEEMTEFYNSLSEIDRQYINVVCGNFADESVLQEQGIYSSDAIIITMETDDEIVLVAKQIKSKNPRAKVIVRSFSDEIEKVLESFGCETVSTSQYALETNLIPFFKK